jgi:hypothetical protein
MRLARRHGALGIFEDRQDLLAHEVSEALAVPRTSADGVENAICRSNAEVGANQQLLERVERIDINRANAPLGGIGDADNLVEALDQLLLGA